MKILEKNKIKLGKNNEREIKLLGLPIIQYGQKGEAGATENYVEVFPTSSIQDIIFEQILTGGNLKYKNFLLSRHGMGETYLLTNIFHHLSYYKNKDEILVVGRRPYINDLFELFCPDVNYQYINLLEWHQFLNKRYYKHKSKIFEIFLPLEYFEDMYNNQCLDNKNFHYYHNLLKYYNLTPADIKVRQPNIDIDYEKKLTNSLASKIDFENLVIITPEALSCTSYSMYFWKKLIKFLKCKNYNVFVNSQNAQKYNFEQENVFYSVKDLYYIARNAKAIIGLRCGLQEVLLSTGVQIHSLYTPHPFRKQMCGQKYIDTHTLKLIPHANTNLIFEYDTTSFNEEQLLSNILERL